MLSQITHRRLWRLSANWCPDDDIRNTSDAVRQKLCHADSCAGPEVFVCAGKGDVYLIEDRDRRVVPILRACGSGSTSGNDSSSTRPGYHRASRERPAGSTFAAADLGGLTEPWGSPEGGGRGPS